MYERPQAKTLTSRLAEPVRQILVITGPRQVGKTTLVRRTLEKHRFPSRYLALDELAPSMVGPSHSGSDMVVPRGGSMPDLAWLSEQWERARVKADDLAAQAALPGANRGDSPAYVLVLDEIQKIADWSAAVKGLWDADRAAGRSMHVVILGSAPLLMQQGLTESLAGRFERMRMTHWSYQEMNQAFDIDWRKYAYFGGYPGGMKYIHDEIRWKNYIRDALIEPNIKKDILMMRRVEKPELLRNVFELACLYSGQELSYNKMLGELKDAGNTTTVANYLALLNEAGLLAGLEKYANQPHRRRASSPKLIAHNTALMTAMSTYGFEEAQADRTYWGRLVESAVGAHLINSAIHRTPEYKVYYWRNGHNSEVDFVLAKGEGTVAIEVKSGAKPGHRRGLDAFAARFQPRRKIIVGEQVPLENFLLADIEEWFQ